MNNESKEVQKQGEIFQAESNPSLNLNLRDTGEEGQLEDISQQESKPEYTQQELDEARKYGYKFPEELEAEGKRIDKVKSVKEFIEYGRKYDREKALEAKLKRIEQQNSELIDYHKRNAENLVRQSMETLERQLTHARNSGNLNEVEQLAHKKAQLEAQQQQEMLNRQIQERAHIDQQFLERNKTWFNESRPDLQEEAKQRGQRIISGNPNIDYLSLVMQVENEMKWAHPEISSLSQSSKPHTQQLTTTPPPHIPSSKSNVNKTTLSSDSEAHALKSLTQQEQLEYKAVKEMVEKYPGVKYTVQEYLDKARRSK